MPVASRNHLPEYIAAFWNRTIQVGECWEWAGPRNKAGYGQGGKWVKGSGRYAHRAAYILAKGPIPDGLTIDHLCRNRACINPTHLEAVTLAENVRRAPLGNARKTHCLRGHPFDEANTRITTQGKRWCIACYRLRHPGKPKPRLNKAA